MAGNKKSSAQLTELYDKILAFLKNCNINIVLFYGSLLGYYRDNTLIEGDDDIDVIISENDHNTLLNYLSRNTDQNIKIGINTKNIIQLYYNNIGPFDIYIFNDNNADILLKHDGNLLFSKSDIFPLKKVLFNKFDIFIPNNTEQIIVDLYGSNWKTPQTKDVDYIWGNVNNIRRLPDNTRRNISLVGGRLRLK